VTALRVEVDARAPIAALADAAPLLVLSAFGVAFGERVILAEVNLRIATRGAVVLMGPAGGGKSTLLRALAGVNRAQPDLRQWGSARYGGQDLETCARRPVLVQQDVRYFTSTVRENLVSAFPDRSELDRAAQSERIGQLLAATGSEDLAPHLDHDALGLSALHRRLLGVLRAVATGAPLICLDESTAGLEAEAADRVLRVIRWYADSRAVLFVTHHQGHAREVADQVVLLAGGRVQQQSASDEFFSADGTPLVRHYLDSGGVALPNPGATAEELSEEIALPPPLPADALDLSTTPLASVGPRDFRWIWPGKLGGLPRPGIVASLDSDLAGLRRLGITTLLTLEEQATVARAALRAAGIEGLHFPIRDMEAPEPALAAEWCREIARRLAAGEVLAAHCRAGLGRTGTVLASQLIWTGLSAVDALDLVRGVNPRWVTSSAQVSFLARFQAFLREPAQVRSW
jgi:atypical dual specificity phosphatase